MSETTRAAFRFVQYLNFFPYSLFVARNDHLCNTLPIFYDKRLSRKIYQDDANLTTVICIDGTGRIQHSNPFLQSQSAPRTNLRLKSLWQSYEQSCRNQASLHGSQRDRFGNISADIHSCRKFGRVCGKRVLRFIDYLYVHIQSVYYLTGENTQFEPKIHTFAVK